MYLPKMLYTVKTMYFISYYNYQNTGIYGGQKFVTITLLKEKSINNHQLC